MRTDEFLLLVVENLSLYLICLFTALVLYFYVFRKVVISIFDPLTIQLIGSMFGFSVVFFLFFTSEIDSVYFSHYLFTQVAFYFGFFIFNQNISKFNVKEIRLKDDLLWLEVSFIIFSVAHICIQLISYKVAGIPLFMHERLSVYGEGGGIGILGRFISMLSWASFFGALSVMNQTTKKSLKFYCRIYIFIVFIFCFLSGSRASFLPLINIYFLYCLLSGNKYILKGKELAVIGVLTLFAVALMFLKTGSANESLIELIGRIIGYGDVYWAAYPNDYIQDIDSSKPLQTLFVDVLGTYRIIPWEQLPTPLGVQLHSIYYGDANMGPNTRHNVYGFAYLGYFISILFSLLLGVVLGYIRNRLLGKIRNAGLVGMLLAVIYMNIASLEADAPYVIGQINSVILTLIVFGPLVILLFLNLKTTKII